MGLKKVKLTTISFLTTNGNDLLLVLVYMDDMIFGSTDVNMTHEFAKLMNYKFVMSMMGELNFFLGL